MPRAGRRAASLLILAGIAVQGLPALAQPASAPMADDAARRELGRLVFTQRAKPSCTVCHTLEAAQSTGAVGPVLDELRPDAERVAKAVRDGLGAMPSFRQSLTESEIAAVARFVEAATGARR